MAGSWIDARFSQDYSNSTTAVKAGNKLPGIADRFVFSELLWSSQSLDGLKPKSNQGTRAVLELTNAGKIFANDVNTVSKIGYSTLNAKLSQGWAVGSATLKAYGRVDNLTNKRHVGSVIVNQAAGQFYELARGRNYTLGLRLVLPI